MRVITMIVASLCMLTACSRGAQTAEPAAPAMAAASPAQPTTPVAATAAPPELQPNLLSFANGTIMLNHFEGERVTAPILMIDGAPAQNWVGDGKPQSFVFELPQRATLHTLAFDNDTSGMGGVDSGIRELTVEVSDTSASTGFSEIFAGSLQKGVNGQRFNVDKPLPGRWLRANFKSNYGGQWYSLAEIRAFGDAPPPPLATNIGGAYTTVWGTYNVVQRGTQITGCFQPDGQSALPGTFIGGIEGNVAKILYVETDADGAPGKPTPALLVFARDGARMFFAVVNAYGNGLDEFRDVPRTQPVAGACKANQADDDGSMASALDKDGRVTVYGINFDFNSAQIRPESDGVLTQMVDMLKATPALAIRIEGHTDDIGGDAFNQALSDKRANAVKARLVSAGIAADRLQAVGKGAGTPIASNATDIGRAQNRRVELIKRS